MAPDENLRHQQIDHKSPWMAREPGLAEIRPVVVGTFHLVSPKEFILMGDTRGAGNEYSYFNVDSGC